MDNIYSNSELVSKFISLQKIIKPDVSIEIGAHAAEFSKEISNFVDKVYAFEASPYVYESVGTISNVNYINKAVSNVDGFIKFEIQDDVTNLAANNSIINRNEDKSYSYIEVESICLNNHFNDYKNICLWIDCEGANREVLTGASDVLQNVSSIFIEVEELEFWKNQWLFKDVNDYLLNKGFVLFARDQEYGNHQYNCIFIKEELKEQLSHE